MKQTRVTIRKGPHVGNQQRRFPVNLQGAHAQSQRRAAGLHMGVRRYIKLWEEPDRSYSPAMCAVALPLLLGGVAI